MDLVFRMRNTVTSAFWYLDDISIYQGGNVIIGNGNFETGNLLPWTVSTSSCGSSGAQITNSGCRTGGYCVKAGCKVTYEQLRQSFSAVAGETYVISFWLLVTQTGPNSYTNVTLV